LQDQGQEFQYIAVDEIGLWPEERMWTFLGTRCRSKDRNIVRMMRASANPGGAGHGWLRKRFISVCRPDGTPYEDPVTGLTRAYVQAKVWDNPSIVENDPEYIAYLRGLPTTMRRQLLDGDWDAGTGLAFERLSESEHLVPYRRPEKWETVFAALDWGYSHNFSAGLYVVGRDGRVTKVDTVMGRRLSPEQIVERCRECFMGHGVPFSRLSYTVAGSDVKMVEKARGTWGPSILEQFMMAGWMLIGADQSRISGYQNMLRYVDWERTKEKHRKPLFQLMDTPGNRRALDCLRTLTVDPDSPNDVLKVDADADSGEGGDDAYDETRYALMSRPLGVQAPQKPEDRVNRALPEPQRPLKSATKPGWAYQLPSRTGTTGKGEVIQ
jgi:hypothetical protein